jgi:hypothetical protein
MPLRPVPGVRELLLLVPQRQAREEPLRLRVLQARLALARRLPQWARKPPAAQVVLQLERLQAWRLRAQLGEAALRVRAERPRVA